MNRPATYVDYDTSEGMHPHLLRSLIANALRRAAGFKLAENYLGHAAAELGHKADLVATHRLASAYAWAHYGLIRWAHAVEDYYLDTHVLQMSASELAWHIAESVYRSNDTPIRTYISNLADAIFKTPAA